MKQKGHQITAKFKSSKEELFKALTKDLSLWWGEMSKPVSKVGDTFRVSWGEPWYEFEVVEYAPNKKLVWKCIDANQKIGELTGVEKEWVGTTVHWEISEEGDGVRLDFEHEGLVTAFLCFDVCSSSWEKYVEEKPGAYLCN